MQGGASPCPHQGAYALTAFQAMCYLPAAPLHPGAEQNGIYRPSGREQVSIAPTPASLLLCTPVAHPTQQQFGGQWLSVLFPCAVLPILYGSLVV